MTTKDYVYLGLILVTALVFYCNGFYAGICRCKRMYDAPAGDVETGGEPAVGTAAETTASDKLLALDDKVLDGSASSREQKLLMPKSELRGDFGNN